MSELLLDTHALIWFFEEGAMAAQAEAALDEVWAAGDTVWISPISGWEIGLLVSRGRLSLSVSPQRWFERALSTPGVGVAPLTVRILIDSSFLPGPPLRDPADRILAATAREQGYRLVTRDRALLGYAEAGHLNAVAC